MKTSCAFSWTFLCMSAFPHVQQKKCMHICERIFLEEPISLPVEKMIHSVIYYWGCWHHSSTDWCSSACCFPHAWFIRDSQHVRPRKWLLLHHWGGGRSSHEQSDSCSAPPPPLTVSHTSDLYVIHFRQVWLKKGWDSLRVQDSLWSPSTTVRRNTGYVLYHLFLQFLLRWSGGQHNVICFTLWASTTNRLHSQQIEPPQSPKTSTKMCGFPRRTWLWVPNIKTTAVSQNITAKLS